jgi:hypothetical protein
LIDQGFRVPEIEPLTTGPSATEVRYFDDRVAESAVKIADLIKSAGVRDVSAKLIPDYHHAARRKQIFEIWFAPDAFSG